MNLAIKLQKPDNFQFEVRLSLIFGTIEIEVKFSTIFAGNIFHNYC